MVLDLLRERRGNGRPLLFVLSLLGVVWMSTGTALAEPPIKNAKDAYCRDQARSKVFSAPDPQNVGLHEVGRRLYQGCMGGHSASKGRRSHGRRYRYRRHRR